MPGAGPPPTRIARVSTGEIPRAPGMISYHGKRCWRKNSRPDGGVGAAGPDSGIALARARPLDPRDRDVLRRLRPAHDQLRVACVRAIVAHVAGSDRARHLVGILRTTDRCVVRGLGGRTL